MKGHSYYLPILTSQLNGKSVVLCGLMYSEEGAAVGVKVSGMRGLRWRVRLVRIPLVGALIQYALLLRALPQPFLQLRRYERELESISADHNSIVGQLVAQLAKIAARDALKAARWELEDAMAANRGALDRLEGLRFADRSELAAALAQKGGPWGSGADGAGAGGGAVAIDGSPGPESGPWGSGAAGGGAGGGAAATGGCPGHQSRC